MSVLSLWGNRLVYVLDSEILVKNIFSIETFIETYVDVLKASYYRLLSWNC